MAGGVAKPSVSIVIVAGDGASLSGAIESARAQRAEPAELIVVQGGSADKPRVDASHLGEIRLIPRAGQGRAAARNAGWRASSGRYLVYLDENERLLPNAVASNLRRFAKEPSCGFVHGGSRIVDHEGNPVAVPSAESGGDAFETLLKGNCIGVHAAVMYSRECLEEANGFDPDLPTHAHYDLYLRLARRHPVASGLECIAEARLGAGGAERDLPSLLLSTLAILDRQRPYLAANPRWRAAHEAGLRDAEIRYATEQLRRARGLAKRPSERGAILRDTLRVLHLAPAETLRAVSQTGVQRLRKCLRSRAVTAISFGDLRRTSPISPEFGTDRGKPVDRRYIEEFLSTHARDIKGRVLEIADNDYTLRFGGAQVTQSDVLHGAEGNPQATLVGDLADGKTFPSETFDCIVLTQTLQYIFDLRKAVTTLHRLLKPGGVLLVTVPGVSSVERGGWGANWYWSLSPAALLRLLEEQFPTAGLTVTAYGNVLAALAFLHGLAEGELHASELDARDPHVPVIVAARARKEDRRELADRGA